MKISNILIAATLFLMASSANALENICNTSDVLDTIQENLESVYDGSTADSPKILSVEKGWTVSEKPFVCKVQLIFQDNGLSGIYQYREKTNRKGETYFEVEPIKTNYDKQIDKAVDQLNKDTDAALNEMDNDFNEAMKDFN